MTTNDKPRRRFHSVRLSRERLNTETRRMVDLIAQASEALRDLRKAARRG